MTCRFPARARSLGCKPSDSNGKSESGSGYNPKAFNQPCQLGADGNPVPDTPAGCVPLAGFRRSGRRAHRQPTDPASIGSTSRLFKGFQISDRFSMQFRAEFFNILNHPNFNAPNFGGNGVTAIGNSGNFTSSTFGEIGSTRDAPYDPRQIQFALKLYY